MKIDEAKTKWCPWARVGNTQDLGYSYNRLDVRGHLLTDNTMCIADKCMVWESLGDGNGYCGMTLNQHSASSEPDIDG